MTTNVPAPVFGPTGLIVPLESAILAGVQADISTAFGGNLNPGLTTPQGQLAQTEAALIGNQNNQFLAIVNGVDPSYATGRMQDAIGRVVPGAGFARIAAQSTVAQVACVGLVNTPIPLGALLQAADGNYYNSLQAATIPASGTITLPFACQVAGIIACPPQVFTIAQTVFGWDTATSTVAGVLGSILESPSAFEARRSASVALNATGFLPAIRAAVLQVAGVLDCYCVENPTPAPTVIGGVTLGQNSIYVAVNGGSSAAVAAAIWSKKPPGCNYTGNTTVTVTDNSIGYQAPLPSYAVTFQRPVSTPILFAVTIANNASVPSNALALIQAAIVSAFGGGDGGPAARIGATLFAARFYAPVTALGAWAANILSLLIGTASAALAQLLLPINQAPVISAGNITLTLV